MPGLPCAFIRQTLPCLHLRQQRLPISWFPRAQGKGDDAPLVAYPHFNDKYIMPVPFVTMMDPHGDGTLTENAMEPAALPKRSRGSNQETQAMATHPDPHPDGVPPPDIIQPQSPDEMPPPATPDETPMTEPDEVTPIGPDYDQPDSTPTEIPPPG